MIIETDMYPADEPWLSLGYTKNQVRSNSKFSGFADSRIDLSATLAQIDEFFQTAISLVPPKKHGGEIGKSGK
jgi:hypothetical protein